MGRQRLAAEQARVGGTSDQFDNYLESAAPTSQTQGGNQHLRSHWCFFLTHSSTTASEASFAKNSHYCKREDVIEVVEKVPEPVVLPWLA